MDLLDICLAAVLLSYFYKLVRGTVAIYIFVGIVIVYIIWKLTEILQMEILSSIFGKFIGVGFFALIVVFQEEIRNFLLVVGTSSFSRQRGLGKLFNFVRKGKKIIDPRVIINSCEQLSKNFVGAIILLEREMSLESFLRTGDRMEIYADQTIIQSFFQKSSPLHDGAMVIQGQTIIATRVILPVTKNLNIPHQYGLRHRAAIGVTEKTDVLALVVSEETGKVSYVKDGRFVSFGSLEDLEKLLKKDLIS